MPGWELNDAIVSLLAKFPPDLAIWSDLQSRFKLDVFVGLFMWTDNQGEELAPATLRMLDERGLVLALDVYGPQSRLPNVRCS